MILDILNNFLFIYIDNIIIFSETEEEHVRMVLRRLLESLFVKVECEFQTTSVSFPDFVVGQG